jgi:hypothetical protein
VKEGVGVRHGEVEMGEKERRSEGEKKRRRKKMKKKARS